ncbi:c-type cytochrome domain-containing protein, partial [Zavarzinella formosa]|uniref:c-type cytochrome domain-containing protein n=1 Tax=Zavarzinella formosa TaxID=360055 RepID=UPI0028F428DC
MVDNMFPQDSPEIQEYVPRVSPPRYGKLVILVSVFLLPLCVGLGFLIGYKAESTRKSTGRETSVASKTAKPERTVTPAPATPPSPTPEPEPAKKSATPPKPPAKKTEKVEPKSLESPEPEEPKEMASKPPEKKGDEAAMSEPKPKEPAKMEPKPEPKPKEPAKPEPKPEPKPKEPAKPKTAAPTFVTSIMPIFQNKCVSCHGPASKKGGLDVATLAALMKGSNNGKQLTAG